MVVLVLSALIFPGAVRFYITSHFHDRVVIRINDDPLIFLNKRLEICATNIH